MAGIDVPHPLNQPPKPAGLPAPPSGAGAGGYNVPRPVAQPRPEFNYNIDSPQGDNPYAGMEDLFSHMTESMGMDQERARTLLAHYNEQYGQGQARKKLLDDIFNGAVLGIGGKGNVNPNDAKTFALMAPQVRRGAQDRDAMLRSLEASGLHGGELDAARANAIIGSYGNQAAARQDLVNKALDYNMATGTEERTGFSPGQDSGAAQNMLGYFSNRYGVDKNAALQELGIMTNRDLSLYSGDRDAANQLYGIDTGAATSRYGADRSYDLGMQNLSLEERKLKMQQEEAQRQRKNGLLGGLFGTLGSILGGPIGGSIFNSIFKPKGGGSQGSGGGF